MNNIFNDANILKQALIDCGAAEEEVIRKKRPRFDDFGRMETVNIKEKILMFISPSSKVLERKENGDWIRADYSAVVVSPDILRVSDIINSEEHGSLKVYKVMDNSKWGGLTAECIKIGSSDKILDTEI